MDRENTMRQQLKITLTAVYTAIFLLLASTGALRTQAAEAPSFCEEVREQFQIVRSEKN